MIFRTHVLDFHSAYKKTDLFKRQVSLKISAVHHRIAMLLFFLLWPAFFGHRQHEFQAVELIDFTRAGIAVDGCDISSLVGIAQFMHNALARNMVGQAAEGLQADHIGHAGVDKLDHFASQEPAFTSHIPQAYMA